MTAANKRYSYPRVAAIRINVHPIGVNPINTHHVFHTRFMYGPRPYISCCLRRQPFASPHKTEIAPYTRRSLGNQRQTGPSVVLDHLILPPSRQPWSRGERFWPSGYTATSANWPHITSM
jgi:hypothetical protein